MDLDRTLGPNDVIGGDDLFFDWKLGGNPLLNFSLGPATRKQALFLCCCGASDTEHGIESVLGVGFEEQRDGDGCQWS